MRPFTLLQSLMLAASAVAVDPAAVYSGGQDSKGNNVQLRIGNGGAGQSGLIEGEHYTYTTRF